MRPEELGLVVVVVVLGRVLVVLLGRLLMVGRLVLFCAPTVGRVEGLVVLALTAGRVLLLTVGRVVAPALGLEVLGFLWLLAFGSR